MTVGDTAVAAAILSPASAARLDMLAVTAFSRGIIPLGPHTSGNPILAMGALHLARRPWPTAAFSRRRVPRLHPTARQTLPLQRGAAR
jgi:hypothetical protein